MTELISGHVADIKHGLRRCPGFFFCSEISASFKVVSVCCWKLTGRRFCTIFGWIMNAVLPSFTRDFRACPACVVDAYLDHRAAKALCPRSTSMPLWSPYEFAWRMNHHREARKVMHGDSMHAEYCRTWRSTTTSATETNKTDHGASLHRVMLSACTVADDSQSVFVEAVLLDNKQTVDYVIPVT